MSDAEAWANTEADFDEYMAHVKANHRWSQFIPEAEREMPTPEPFDKVLDPESSELTIAQSLNSIKEFDLEAPKWLSPALATPPPADLSAERKKMFVNVVAIELADMLQALN